MNKTQIHGFTLIEMLVSIALLGAAIAAAVGLFNSISKSQYQARVKTDLTVAGNRMMDTMIKTIREGSSASAPTCPTAASTLTVVNPSGSVEYLANGNCSQSSFSLASGASGNGVIQKSYPGCATGLGAGSISEDSGKTAVDVWALSFCLRSLAGAPLTVDINLTLSPSKTLSNLAPAASQMRVNFTSSVGQRTYSP